MLDRAERTDAQKLTYAKKPSTYEEELETCAIPKISSNENECLWLTVALLLRTQPTASEVNLEWG